MDLKKYQVVNVLKYNSKCNYYKVKNLKDKKNNINNNNIKANKIIILITTIIILPAIQVYLNSFLQLILVKIYKFYNIKI